MLHAKICVHYDMQCAVKTQSSYLGLVNNIQMEFSPEGTDGPIPLCIHAAVVIIHLLQLIVLILSYFCYCV